MGNPWICGSICGGGCAVVMVAGCTALCALAGPFAFIANATVVLASGTMATAGSAGVGGFAASM